MLLAHRKSGHRSPGSPFVLLCVVLAVLWLAGGASRGDVAGQVVVRGAAWIVLVGVALFGTLPKLDRLRPVAFLLAAAIGIVLLQLVPLPPGVWQALPGRGTMAMTATISGLEQPWRPLAIVPAAAVNAASSLVVPLLVLLLVAMMGEREHARLPGVLLSLVTASAFLGLLQFSGARIDNPMINDSLADVSGSFANRNHFALFLALGCLTAPAWAFLDGRRPGWRAPIALGLTLLFALAILASGSRAGMLTGALALAMGGALSWNGAKRELARLPRWVFPLLLATVVGLVAGLVLLSVAVDRATSIRRAIEVDVGHDMRARATPTVLAMIGDYFPTGSGYGGFERMFALQEPIGLLQLTYFNHAHNDFLEIALDGGLPGVVLLVAAISWWIYAGVRAWRTETGAGYGRLGFGILLLVIVASLFDYPARTPMIMAVMVMAAAWLCGARGRSAQPDARFTGR